MQSQKLMLESATWGWLPSERVWRHLAELHIVIVCLHPVSCHQVALPVVVSDFPLWRRIVSEHACGIAVNPTDSVAVAEAIDMLAPSAEICRRMGRNDRLAVDEESYILENESRALLDIHKRILS